MKALLLLIIALVMLSILTPIAFVCSVVMLFVKDDRKLFKGISNLLYAIAVAIDVLGNVLCADLFNITLIKHGGYRFGVVGEKCSSVLGKNQLMGSPSKTGWFIIKALDKIEKDHCIKWIDNRFTN